FFIVAGSIRVPIGFLHQLAKGPRVTFAEQVAGTLPAENVPRRVPPGCAPVVPVSGEEIEKQARLAERPRARAATAAENVAEELLGAGSRKKMRLVGRSLVRVSRRYGDAIDAERTHAVEKFRDAVGLGIVEQRAVDIDPESAFLRRSNRRRGAFMDAVLAHRTVVHLAVADQVHRPDEIAA